MPPADIESSIDCYNATLRALLDKHAPTELKHVTSHPLSARWYDRECRDVKCQTQTLDSVGCVPSSHKQPGNSNSIHNGSCTRGNSRRSGSTLSTRASVTQELCGGPWTHCFNLHRSATPTNSLLNSSLGFSKRRSSPYDCPPRLPTHWSSLLGV